MQVVTRKATLENALAIGDWLIERSHEDPVVIFEVRTRLDEATKAVEEVSMMLSSFKSEAHRILLSEQECSEMADDLESRLDRLDVQFSLLDPISARYPTTRQQHDYFKPLFHQVQQLRDSRDALDSFHEKEGVYRDEAKAGKVRELTSRWQVLWNTAANYHLQITTVLPFEERHHYAMKRFTLALLDGEKQCESLQKESKEENENLQADVKV